MLRISTKSTSGNLLEQEVDEAIDTFDAFYKRLQTKTDPETGDVVGIGLIPVERAAIKTFCAYFLGVGGHYTPPKD